MGDPLPVGGQRCLCPSDQTTFCRNVSKDLGEWDRVRSRGVNSMYDGKANKVSFQKIKERKIFILWKPHFSGKEKEKEVAKLPNCWGAEETAAGEAVTLWSDLESASLIYTGGRGAL